MDHHKGFDFGPDVPPELNPLGLPDQDDRRLETWSIGVDLLVSITDRLTFKGEY